MICTDYLILKNLQSNFLQLGTTYIDCITTGAFKCKTNIFWETATVSMLQITTNSPRLQLNANSRAHCPFIVFYIIRVLFQVTMGYIYILVRIFLDTSVLLYIVVCQHIVFCPNRLHLESSITAVIFYHLDRKSCCYRQSILSLSLFVSFRSLMVFVNKLVSTNSGGSIQFKILLS